MKLETWTALLLLIVPQFGWGQTNGASKLSEVETAAPLSHNTYSVIGATPRQETLLRAQIQVMNAEILPLRIVFVPHWKYLDTARTFHLHVPTGYTSAMFTHLPSRTVFIQRDPSVDPSALNLNRILPLRFDFKDCLNASLNWSSGYTCSTAAESDPSATRSPSFW